MVCYLLAGVKYFMALCRAARLYTVGLQRLVDEDLAENTEGWCGHAVALKPDFEISEIHWSCQQRLTTEHEQNNIKQPSGERKRNKTYSNMDKLCQECLQNVLLHFGFYDQIEETD
ncbi:Beta-1,3-Galactosyl-O-Glycosyl-Glycoprotein Beta-1,6-N-Acetylglucosaminyltransferase 7 [Manis pentadactyla]|nr:Beta-1,3-Galactosyl-O-Glycosyl-Glycoprotein Beta-1,6-N-Acetylglucosaminyltransferase 7 [Manis pentadactyla]